MVFGNKVEEVNALLVKHMAQLCCANVESAHKLLQLPSFGWTHREASHAIHNFIDGMGVIEEGHHSIQERPLVRILIREMHQGLSHWLDQALGLCCLGVESGEW